MILRIVFGDAEQVSNAAIIHALREMPESPWNDLKGRPLDDRGLARELRQYGIKPRVLGSVALDPRGYRREDFVDAWEAIPPPIAAEAQRPQQAATLKEINWIVLRTKYGGGYVADEVCPERWK